MQSLSSLMTHNHLLLKSRHRPVYLIVSMKKGVNLYQKSKPSGFFFLIFSNHGVNIPPQVFVKQRSWSCATGEGVSVVGGMSWGESSKSGSSYRLLHAPGPGWQWVTERAIVTAAGWLWHNSLVVVCGNWHCPAPACSAQAPSLVHCIRHN